MKTKPMMSMLFFDKARLFTLWDGSINSYCICKNCPLVSLKCSQLLYLISFIISDTIQTMHVLFPDVTTCCHHIEQYHIISVIMSTHHKSFYTDQCKLSMIHGVRRTPSLQNFSRPSKRLRKDYSRVNLMEIYKRFLAKSGAFHILTPYFVKWPLSGWLPLIR